ncbi:MAG: rhodanese-like domain-containing protein, partial [Pseudomonadota bacterium]
VETGAPAASAKGDFTARPAGLFVNADTVAAALAAGETVVDVRAANRFAGSVPEPRPGIRAGHMPGGKNLHYAMLVDENGSLKPDHEIAQIVKDAGIDASKPVITSCGSGVTAAILAVALARQGTEVTVYDGSWTEWGGDHTRAVVTSEGGDSSGG